MSAPRSPAPFLQQERKPDHLLRRAHEAHDLHLVPPRVQHEVVAVVTVRMAARASTAPTASPVSWKSRRHWARLSHPGAALHFLDLLQGREPLTSSRVPSGVAVPRRASPPPTRGAGCGELVHDARLAERALQRLERLALET